MECYSHIAGKKYWIISLVVEVITCQSNEFITRGLRPLVINFITLTRDYLNHSWYYPILFASYMGISHSQIQNVEPLYITRRSILQYLLITSMGMDFIPMLVTTSMGMKSIPMLVVKIYSISWMEYWKINNLIWIFHSFWLKNFRIYLKKNPRVQSW